MTLNGLKQGFTLIELVVVIVILGILAVTAAPYFINLQDDARTADLEGIKAAFVTEAELVYAKALIDGKESNLSDSVEYTADTSKTAAIKYGYPTAAEMINLLGIDASEGATSTDTDFKYKVTPGTGGGGDTLIIYFASSGKVYDDIKYYTESCIVFYTEPIDANPSDPIFTVEECP
ncbi:type II secretion system protein [Thalassotalea agarivorans]|uniref:MSHA pilin protein MshA n=1 Tax=Thalassotalea agarivorans TaxID=349064 RepID=A0A1I0G2A6_THASX|nr:type II secretion system protein [Thalassotalea agarivorans]SET63989.1 MSHA pilin protein MshA [Thalassotalea agarivorans]